MAQKKNKRPVAYTGSNTTAKKTNGGTVLAVIAFILVCIVTLGLFAGFSKGKNKDDEIAALKAEIAALKDDVAKGDATLKDGYTDGDTALSGLIAAGDATLKDGYTTGDAALDAALKAGDSALSGQISDVENSLSDRITAGDAALADQITAGDNALSDSIAELEESIVWYQHDVQLNVWARSEETAGTSTAMGFLTISIINNNPNAYDCIDEGNGDNAFMTDFVNAGIHSASGYVLIGYVANDGRDGRYLTYMTSSTTLFDVTDETSAYAGLHLYVYVHGLWAGSGDAWEGAKTQAKLIPAIDVNGKTNDSRLILTDDAGIATCTIADTVTKISIK